MQGGNTHRLYIGLAGTLLLLVVCLAQAATLRNPEEAKELAEKVLSRVVVGDIERAFTLVKPYWPFPESELEAQAAQTVQQRSRMANRLGKSVGFVLVRREMLPDAFLRLTYIEKFDNTGLRWLFTFYKAKDAWRCHSLSWDDDIRQLFSSGH